MSDGDLRSIFRRKLPGRPWSPIESGSTTLGLPDAEYAAPGGVSGWLETKQTHTLRVVFRPLQTHWLAQRAALGGRCAVAIRRRPAARKLEGLDELWLVDGSLAFQLEAEGLSPSLALCVGAGGPASWNWAIVEQFLLREPS
jgi:hypothetical protein